MKRAERNKQLIVAGALLFLAGLVQGAMIQAFVNPRMALSAHLTAVQCGMALMICGAIWSSVALSVALATAAQGSLVVGFYALWAGLSLASANGASTSLPLAGAGHRASPAGEQLVSVLVTGGSGLILLGWSLFVLGLIRAMPRPVQS